MRGFIHLSGEHPDLALAELKGALEALGSQSELQVVSDQIVLLNAIPPRGLADRMGLCHFTGELFSTAEPKLPSILEALNDLISDIDKERSVSVKVKVPGTSDGITASMVFDGIVELLTENHLFIRHRDPDQTIFVIIDGTAYIGMISEWSDRRSARSRRGSRLPFNRPIVMEPKLARAMVNISGLPPGSLILDPFLGPGGLAIEAAFLGNKVAGIERDPEIYHGARVNIKELGLEGSVIVKNGDSRKMDQYSWTGKLGSVDGIITDPPFGRSAATMGEDPGELLRDVLKKVHELLPDGAPLVLDSSSREIIDSINGFEFIECIPVRVHKSMTRFIALMRKKN